MKNDPNGSAAPPGEAEEIKALKLRRQKRKLRRGSEKEIKTGLTSMIDIVFLLIFFFMVVTDLQNMEIEEIDLPFASEAKPDEPPEPKRVVVNMNQDGKVSIMGWKLGPQELSAYLERAARDGPRDRETNLPTLAVKVRADQAVEYLHVRDLMVRCMKIGVWNMSFAARPEPDEKGLLAVPEPR